MAQSDESKIVVEITKDVNGERKTFKGEYDSTEEMKADPQYQEFAGEEEGFNFWFDTDDRSDIFLHLDQFQNRNGSSFHFFKSDDGDDGSSYFFKHFDGDSVDGFFDIHLDGMDMDEYKEKMEELGINLDAILNRLDDNGENDKVKVFVSKNLKITDVDDEFGKKGVVSENNILKLDELDFSPNPSSNGRFKVRFKLPEEGELDIEVSNLDGKTVFSRHFDRFGGTYSEMIDLSGQKDGIYLLEITQGKKRLTRKIVIN